MAGERFWGAVCGFVGVEVGIATSPLVGAYTLVEKLIEGEDLSDSLKAAGSEMAELIDSAMESSIEFGEKHAGTFNKAAAKVAGTAVSSVIGVEVNNHLGRPISS